eukprot:scaffold582_cov385-Prasinococcus_capsulatus_cf.AAC.47
MVGSQTYNSYTGSGARPLFRPPDWGFDPCFVLLFGGGVSGVRGWPGRNERAQEPCQNRAELAAASQTGPRWRP